MLVNPHRVTVALDRAGLVGPSADARLGAVVPDLDDWEAGRSQPSPAQLGKLAVMARVSLGFFALSDDEAPRIGVARVQLGPRRHCETLVMLLDEIPVGQVAGQLAMFEGAELVELPDGTFVPCVIGTV